MSDYISKINSYLTIAMIAILVIWFLIGFARGLFKSVWTAIFNLIAILISVPVTKILLNSAYAVVEEPVTNLLNNTLPADLVGNENIVELIRNFAMAVAAIVSFMAAYLAIAIILKLIAFIIGLITVGIINRSGTDEEGRKHGLARLNRSLLGRLIGSAISIVNIFAFFLVMLAPVSGLLKTSYEAMDIVTAADATGTSMEENIEKIEPVKVEVGKINDSSVVKTSNTLFNSMIYKSVSSFEIDGRKTDVDKEVLALAEVSAQAIPLLKEDTSSFTEDDVDQVQKIIDGTKESDVTGVLLTEIVRDASTSWSKGRTYMGMEMPGKESAFNIPLKMLFTSFSTMNDELLYKTFDSVISIFRVTVKSGILEKVTSDDEIYIGDLFGNSDFLSDIFVILYDNELIRPTIGEFINSGLNLVSDSLELAGEVEITKVDMNKVTREQMAKEGHLISEFVVEITSAMEKMDKAGNNLALMPLKEIGSAFDKLQQSIFLGEYSRKMVAAYLKNNALASYGALGAGLVSKIESGDLNVGEVLEKAGKLLEIADSLDFSSTESVSDSVSSIVENLDGETIGVLADVITPEMLSNVGLGDVTEGDSEIVKETLGNIFAESDKKDDVLVETLQGVGSMFGLDQDELAGFFKNK